MDFTNNSEAGKTTGGGPQIVVIGNEKGGTGKSTTALHLAVAALYRGYRVGAIDLDSRQGTLSRYLANRERYGATANPLPLPDHVRVDEPPGGDAAAQQAAAQRAFGVALAELAGCEVIIVDTPGSPSALSRVGHEHADILVTPLNDSLLDIDVLAEIDPIGRKIVAPCHYCRMAWEYGNQRIADGLPPIDWLVIRNRLPHIHSRNRADVAQILEKLAHRIGFRLASGLGERVVFRELFLHGLTVLDLPASAGEQALPASHKAATQEVAALLAALNLAPPATAGRYPAVPRDRALSGATPDSRP